MDDLKAELEEIRQIDVIKTKEKKLRAFQDKLASLTFMDPAAGSGNFLTESYICIRKLENEAIRLFPDKQITMGVVINPIKVSISQFYGIEINDFAVTVARTALWIAENQMMKETEDIMNLELDFLPLKTNAYIVEGNALRIDWNDVVPKDELNYIMGNPPFVGRRYRTPVQQEDVSKFFSYKDVDYVACWYAIAAEYIRETSIYVAFVSTNSICQGEQVPPIWGKLLSEGIEIQFAYRTFVWDSEANKKAHVYCVIIGFSCIRNNKNKIIIDRDGQKNKAENINGYLVDAPDIVIKSRTKPLGNVPKMQNGNVPLDGDALKIEEQDYHLFSDCKYVKKLIGGSEMLYNRKRYVLWLVDATPAEIKSDRRIVERVELCRKNRLAMKDKGTQKLADRPTMFRDTNNPERYIAVPMVSGERRRYIPMAYYDVDTIPTNQVQIIPDATMYHFGVLESNVHMAWMRVTCGRLKSDYRYSKGIVYNCFPWPDPSDEQRQKIESTAQSILNVRSLYPDDSLADLYDPNTMPKDLLKAHRANDRAVMRAYGMPIRETDEAACVAWLMRLYQEKVMEIDAKSRKEKKSK